MALVWQAQILVEDHPRRIITIGVALEAEGAEGTTQVIGIDVIMVSESGTRTMDPAGGINGIGGNPVTVMVPTGTTDLSPHLDEMPIKVETTIEIAQ